MKKLFDFCSMMVFVVIMLFTMLFAMPKMASAAPVSFAGLGTTFSINAGTMTVLYDDTAVRLSTGIITDNLNAEIAARIAADAAIAVDTTAISNVKLSTTGGSMSGTLTMTNAGIVMTGINATIVTSSDVTGAKFIGSGAGLTAASVPAAAIAAGSLGASVVASSIAANTVLPSKVAAGTYTTITLPAANVAAGSLGANVIVSSYALASVPDDAIIAVSGSKVTDGVAAANIAAGSLPADVIASSIALNAVQDGSIVGVSSSKILAGALDLVTTLKASDDVEIGTPNKVSTFSVTEGDLNLHNNLTAANVIIKGDGYLFMGFKTKAALLADVPLNQGEVWFCSNCTKDTLVVSTGTAVSEAGGVGAVSTIADRTVAIQ